MQGLKIEGIQRQAVCDIEPPHPSLCPLEREEGWEILVSWKNI